MNDLVMLVPTRGRPQSVRPVMDAFLENSVLPSTLLFIIDDNDESGGEYVQAVLASPSWQSVRLIKQKAQRLGPTLNEWAPALAKEYRHVGFMGDDHRPRTKGFDARLVSALDATGGGVAYGNDLIHGAEIPTAAVLSSDVVLALNAFVPFAGTHLFFDNAWKTLGFALGQLTYLDDVVIEHMHPIAGKSQWDTTYRAANDGAVYAADEQLYADWVKVGLDADIEKIRAYRAATR